MGEKSEIMTTTITVKLKPWIAPGFAVRHGVDGDGIPVRELSDDALEDMCLAWVRSVYTQAGRHYCPFEKPVKCAP